MNNLQVKQIIDSSKEEYIVGKKRDNLFLTQTPQAFRFKDIYDLSIKQKNIVQDEATLFINNNIKIKAGLNLHKDISFFMNQNIKFNELSHDCWVLNMSSEYTKNNIDIDKTELEKYAQSIFEETFDIKNNVSFIKSHRWLYAQTKLSYNTISKKNWINSKDNKIFLSGDWVLGKSLSDAWDAGEKLSHYIKILSV